MRLALALTLVLSACGARTGGGVSWPQMAERESDGGESLAPRPGAAAIASAVEAADKNEEGDDDITVVSSGTEEAKPAAASSASTATSGVAETPDENPITIDDIVIEIEE